MLYAAGYAVEGAPEPQQRIRRSGNCSMEEAEEASGNGKQKLLTGTFTLEDAENAYPNPLRLSKCHLI